MRPEEHKHWPILTGWMDTLGPDDLDDIITHPDPTCDGERFWDHARQCGCLIGCVVEGRARRAGVEHLRGYPFQAFMAGVITQTEYDAMCYGDMPPAYAFPDVCHDCTPEATWAAVKKYAVSRVKILAPTPENSQI